jgi:hypothetical protein
MLDATVLVAETPVLVRLLAFDDDGSEGEGTTVEFRFWVE